MKTAYKYLKSTSYYSDLYDRLTIEECRRLEKRGISGDKISIETDKSKKDKIKKEFTVRVVVPTMLYFVKGERYSKKSQTIREWMERDKAKDKKLENAVTPIDIFCKKCGSEMTATLKDFHGYELKGEERILFFFECPNECKPRRAVFEDGEEWKPKPHICEKCSSEVKTNDTRKEDRIITTYACKKCGHKGREILDLNSPKEKIDKNFERDRRRFCLSGEKGQEYIGSEMKLKHLMETIEGIKEKEKITKVIAKIKKLSVAGLKKLLTPKSEKEGYSKWEFSKPEINRDVVVRFTVQDDKEDRQEYDSRSQLKKLLKQTLENTNWRLMNEGINYRLGILTGRLKGHENDEDLMKLIKS
ncbi:hypothetical protein KKF60_03100 [Patescibacteria group bacterium]|nr:hypothetical protein [Patescibacteria group bacterium]MBU4458857.1 hypothetical protein [Patescibacteria group bacterium]MCG2696142.1 hypothetical protein [Candidatus Portnoybacteria bacterium]